MRRFLRLQLAFAMLLWTLLLEAKSVKENGKKWSAAAAWEPSGAPGVGDDETVQAGKNIKIEAAAKGRSLVVEGEVTSTAAGELTLGTSTAQAENIALKVTAAATISGWTAKIKFNSTSPERLTVDFGGKARGEGQELKFEAGKYKLASALTITGGSGAVKLEKSVDVETAEKTIEATNVEALEKATFNFTGSTIKLVSAGTIWNVGAEATLTSTSSTIEVTNTGATEKVFNGEAKKYNNLKFPGVNIVVSGANTLTGTLSANNGAAKPAAGKGLRLTKSVKQILQHATTPIDFGSTSGSEVARLEADTEAEADRAKLEATAVKGKNSANTGDFETLATCVIRNIEWVTGTLYAPNATEIPNCTKIVKGAEPSSKTAPSVSGGGTVSVTVARVVQIAAVVTGGPVVTAVATPVSSTPKRAGTAIAAAQTSASVARQAVATGSASTGASASASVARIAKIVASPVSGGPQASATIARKAKAAPSITVGPQAAAKVAPIRRAATVLAQGAIVSATVKRVARVAVAITTAAQVNVKAGIVGPRKASVSTGATVTVSVTAISTPVEPPTSTPIEGHVAVGQVGTIGGHMGRIPTGNIGRAER